MKNNTKKGCQKYLAHQWGHDALDLNYLVPLMIGSLLLLATLKENIVVLDLHFRVLTCVSAKGGYWFHATQIEKWGNNLISSIPFHLVSSDELFINTNQSKIKIYIIHWQYQQKQILYKKSNFASMTSMINLSCTY